MVVVLEKTDENHRTINIYLIGDMKEEAGKSPENLITLHTALGFWAEGSGDNKMAIEHYKKALESFLDTWIKFEFARERIKSLRQPSG